MLAVGCSLVRSKRLFLRPDLASSRRRGWAVSNPPSSAGPEPRAAPGLGASMARTDDLPRPAHDATLGPVVEVRRSVTAISTWRLNRSDGLQIKIDHLLKRLRGGTFAQAFRQRLEPGSAFGLDREQLGRRVVPALRAASPRRRLGTFGGEWRPKRQHFGALARLALGVAQRGGTFGQAATGHRFLRYVCARRSWRDPAGGRPAQVRGSARLVASVAHA